MICRIADFCIEIIPKYKKTEEFCKDYICDDAENIDFCIEITEEDLIAEVSLVHEKLAVLDGARAVQEPAALYRRICSELLKRDAFLLHGVALEYEGKGYIFTAQSGTGKTTHSLLWKKVFGEDKVTIVNGDKPIIRFIDGKVYAYGTPWNGKERFGTNGRVEVSNLCFVTRGETNEIERISVETAVPLLFSQIMIHDSSNLAKQLDLADRFLTQVPTHLLHCNIDEEAALVAYKGMNK